MKSKYFSFIAVSLILVMLVLATGCGVRINGKEYEFFTVSQKDRNNIFNSVGSESSNIQQISEDRQDGEKIVISNNAGNIRFKKSATSQIEIKAEKKVRGASTDTKESILQNMNVKLERDGKVIKVVFKTKDGDDFWDWQKNNFKAFQISANFDIELPEGITEISAKTGAGNIDVNDVSAKLSLDTGAGNIDVEDVYAIGDSVLSTGAGNIDFTGKIDAITSFDASTGVGNVKFEVPEETKMSLKVDTGVGNLSGHFIQLDNNKKFHFVGDINGGGPSVVLNTGVGNVKVD